MLGVVILVLVLGGIVAQGDEIKSSASAAADKAQSWLEDAGVDSSGGLERQSERLRRHLEHDLHLRQRARELPFRV